MSHHLILSPLIETAAAVKLGTALPPSVPAKPTVQLNRAALSGLGLKGLPLRPDARVSAVKPSAAASMDDFAESGRKLVMLGDMPPVDLALTEGTSVGENLEVDEDEDVLQDVVMADGDAADEEEEVDPLDAFMTGVKQEVKKVNALDRVKLQGGSSRIPIDGVPDEDTDEPVAAEVPDDMDTTNMRPEDILA